MEDKNSTETNRLKQILTDRRKPIIRRWRDAIIQTYPSDAAKFLQRDKDQFGNPIGYTIAQETDALYTALLADDDLADFSAPLDRIVRIRAIQEFSPARAVSFVFLLKVAIRDELAETLEQENIVTELLEFESQIDRLALLAFDNYMNCREQVFRIRASEIKKWSTTMKSRQENENNDNKSL